MDIGKALVMDETLKVINELEKSGVIGRYTIGGAIGLLFYVEPATTYDLDIFCYIPKTGMLYSVGPIYEKLMEKGYTPKGEHMMIEGVPVQFLPPTSDLVTEAIEQSVNLEFSGVPTRVMQFEHLLAIMVETGRGKDKVRIAQALESKVPDETKLNDILSRYNLLDKWARIVT
ncbi:MAG: hypothetical protein JSS83_23230 [Cyanobacteria bacterium SZAS LIN-3]|nr:hypothetical protein [Cyanobacteria bacterium SZAS LIN-3]